MERFVTRGRSPTQQKAPPPPPAGPLRVLELFSGTGSVGDVCQQRGYEVVCLDLNAAADINMDIMKWDYKQSGYKPGDFHVIWASPPCHTFSSLRCLSLGKKLKCHGGRPATRAMLQADMYEMGLPLLRKAEEIIECFKPMYWFIENPDTGKMKKFMTKQWFYVIDYCVYSSPGDQFPYRKRTRIWSNMRRFRARRCKELTRCAFCVPGTANKHRQTLFGAVSRNNKYRIPMLLVHELLGACRLDPSERKRWIAEQRSTGLRRSGATSAKDLLEQEHFEKLSCRNSCA
jgi:hypothetical protein